MSDHQVHHAPAADTNSSSSSLGSTMKSSMEIWAASKFIGRECATINKLFYVCKRDNGDNPTVCSKEGKAVLDCGNNVISELYTKFPEEYKAFQVCLDQNDYRFADCRKSEKALLACWNNAHNLKDFAK